MWASVLNAGIRMLVLVGLAMLVTKAQRRLKLERRVQVLEGILPICGFCKKIRRPDGTWEQLETYISQRSAAKFSHGLCDACGREHYPQQFPDPEVPKVEPSATVNRRGTAAGT